MLYLDKGLNELNQLKDQIEELHEEAESAEDVRNRREKIYSNAEKELNEGVQKEVHMLIDEVINVCKAKETIPIVLDEQEGREELKKEFMLKPNANNAQRKQYIQEVFSLFKEDASERLEEKPLDKKVTLN